MNCNKCRKETVCRFSNSFYQLESCLLENAYQFIAKSELPFEIIVQCKEYYMNSGTPRGI